VGAFVEKVTRLVEPLSRQTVAAGDDTTIRRLQQDVRYLVDALDGLRQAVILVGQRIEQLESPTRAGPRSAIDADE
jgi:hypothetical protein